MLVVTLIKFYAEQKSLILSALIVAIIGIIILFNLISAYKNKRILKKISVKDATIEIFEQSNESYFDKYLNEVLYLFENTEADVIVFEDIDRYNSAQIFERLREINGLVNKHNLKSAKKILRFFYLLRDDVFVSKDRTKFFDFVIPVIPIVDGTSSYDVFLQIVNNAKILDIFDEKFLQNISLYIDDMRILKNIFNEFQIYKSKLDSIELDPNKLLSIIAYKNIFPRDFCELQLGRGFLATLFAKKEEFLQVEVSKNKEKITKLQHILTRIENEHVFNVEEIETLYDKNIESLRYRAQFEEREKFTKESNLRKNAIKIRDEGRVDDIKARILKLNKDILQLKTKKLNEIINRENIDSIFDLVYVDAISRETRYLDIKGNEYFSMLKYLIRNGFIDETYSDYMAYFYAQSLSRGDKTFLRSIADKKCKDFSYKLREADKVVSRLSEFDFEQIETLNFDLLEYLLCETKHSKYLDRMILQLKKDKNYSFIIGYFELNKKLDYFITALNAHWPELFSLMLKYGKFTSEAVKKYVLLTIQNSSDAVIKKVNIDSVLSQTISKDNAYLEIQDSGAERASQIFKMINVSFVSLTYKSQYKKIFYYVYDSSSYDINYHNISTILREVLGVDSEQDCLHKSFTFVFKNSKSPIYSYITENLSIYIDMLSNLNTYIIDDPEAFEFILNCDGLSIEQKKLYIDMSRTVVTDILKINDKDIWKYLLRKQIMSPESKNIINYFSVFSYDESLIEFLNKCQSSLDFFSQQDDDILMKFFTDTVVCNRLCNKKFSLILKQIGYIYKEKIPKGIDNDKVELLIDLKIFRMTESTLTDVRGIYSSSILKFIIKNIEDYVSLINEELYDKDELLSVLSATVPDKYKLSLLKFEDGPLSIFKDIYSDKVIAYILKNNLDESEIGKILSSYITRESVLKEIIRSITITKCDIIFMNRYTIPQSLYDDTISNDEVSDELKIKLFSLLLPELDIERCKKYLTLLSLSDFLDIFTNKRPKFSTTKVNERILEIFKNKKWIRDFSVDEENTDIFKVYKPRFN